MEISLEQFSRQLVESGLISAKDIDAALKTFSGRSSRGAERLARLLVRQKKLTAYQARKIYRNQAERLVLGNYVILDKLGQGGMGVVYKARHRRMGRLVALKVLSPQVTKSRTAVARFHTEVRAAARLNHPNIVTAYDADESSDRHFLVLEYVAGTDLAARVRKHGPLPVEQAVECVLKIARGLEYAHARGIVHRDIKPSNLLLGVGGSVKILDMGLARIESSSSRREPLTRAGQIMGTVDYMAPEQAFDASAVDFRSDIYSLGATLWYLLTGRTMYQGNNAIQILMAHQARPIPSLCEACSDVTGALEAIFVRMVAKKPDERFSSMTEVIAALESRQIDSAPVRSDEPTSEEGFQDLELNEFFRTMNRSDGTVVSPASVATARKTKSAGTTVSMFDNIIETDSAIDLMQPRPASRRGAANRSRRAGWWPHLRIPKTWWTPLIIAVVIVATSISVAGIIWRL